MKPVSIAVLQLLFFSAASRAQQTDQDSTTKTKHDDMQNMAGMSMSQMPGMKMGQSGMNMHPETFVQEILAHDTSGTSAEPNSTPAPMLMKVAHSWTLMFHANVFVLDEQQSGPRGGDKFFST